MCCLWIYYLQSIGPLAPVEYQQMLNRKDIGSHLKTLLVSKTSFERQLLPATNLAMQFQIMEILSIQSKHFVGLHRFLSTHLTLAGIKNL